MTAAARRLLWPGLMTVAMMIVLLGLGGWQVKRLIWKQGVLARIEHAEAVEPVPLPEAETRPGSAASQPSPFTKVSVTGVFPRDDMALYGAEVRNIASGPAMGAHLIEPLRRAGGNVILVDLGWVPLSRPQPLDQSVGAVTVTGYVRPGDKAGWFSAADDPATRRFFTLDPKSHRRRPRPTERAGVRALSRSAMKRDPSRL